MLGQQGLDAPDDHLHGHTVVPALGNDDVGVLLGALHACHTDIFFSRRGDKTRSGRFGAVVMLR